MKKERPLLEIQYEFNKKVYDTDIGGVLFLFLLPTAENSKKL